MGGSSGGGGHTPYEAPDNLKSAQRLSAIGLISLGPIRGAVTEDQYQSAFFDYTPIKNSKGEWNYQNTLIRYRLGYQDQQPLEDFDASEREVSVGAEVKAEHPLSRSVIDPDIDRLRITLGVNALFSQNDQGDTHGTSVQLEILINGQSRQTVTIDGKSSSRFHRSYLIDNLPPRPFTVTVQRVTPDSKSQRLQNATFWSSYTEIISTKLSYPNMAIVGIKTDSRYNPSFPNINFLLYGRLVKVPSNYDPDTRTYGSGLWRGDFKLAWTNNPAWVFYDLVTNKLAGLGQRLGDYGIDKFQLYQIAQYCDQQVPDGYGGVEPRMVANLWLTEQRDAYSVISDMASVFRAIVVWNGTQLTAIQDRNADPVCSFTQANVIDGKFNRQYVPLKSIFTAVEVEYADERNNYQKAIEYVADDAMIKRYGYNVKKIVAFACTTRGQARRYGKWVLETSRLEQCTISFSVGREGLQVLPGDIIEIADKSYANVNLGGRVLAINGRTVTLDAPIEVDGEKHLSYLVNDNNGQRLVRRKISQINAQNKSLVTLDSEPTGLQVMDTWALHTPLVSTQRYRVLGVAENEDGSYGITALQHEPQKERIVDEGAVFAPASETLHKVEPQLTHLGVQPTLSGDMKVSWEVTSGNGTVKYDIKVLKDGKLYLFKRDESSSELNLADLANGEYQVTIIARDAQGRMLSEKVQSFTIDNPPAPKNVSVSGGLSDITLSWDFVDEATQTEIWASETNNIANAERIAKVTANIYTHNVGPRQTRYYWLRHTRGINVGDWYQQQGLSAETGADIDAELALLNEKLGQNIIDEVFDTAMPARKLEMTKTVARIDNPAENIGYNQVYNEADGKLYVWDGRKYTAKVQAVDLEGKLASNQLDQALINQLTQASSTASTALSKANTVQSALAQEVNQRTQAIQAETRARTQALQAEASARSTAVSRLEQIDREQAQLITTATTKADNALSGLSDERQARIAGDNAEAQARAILTTRVASAESGISTLQNSVASANRSVSELSQNLNAKIDRVEVGGRNYLKNSSFSENLNHWRNWGDCSRTFEVVNRKTFLRIKSSDAVRYKGVEIYADFKPNTNYVISVTAFSPNASVLSFGFHEEPNRTQIWSRGVTLGDTPKRYSFSFKSNPDPNKSIFNVMIGMVHASPCDIYIADAKLEIGTIATDWTPAPEDVEQSISAVSAELTSHKSTQAEVDRAQTAQITAHTARLGTAESKIQSAEQAIATLDNSVATRLAELNATVLTKEQNLDAKITAEQNARANGDKASTDSLNALASRVNNAESGLSTLIQTVATQQQTSSTEIRNLTATIKQNRVSAELAKASVSGNVLHVTAPEGGALSLNGNVTGAIKIRLPQRSTNTMIKFDVEVFNYSTGTTVSYTIAGYSYASGYWVNVTATMTGGSKATKAVRFGNDGVKDCVWIGELDSVWSYSKIRVTNFIAGYSNYGANQWQTGWQISIVTAFDTVQHNYDTHNPAKSVDKVTADLTTERTARTSADEALGRRVDTVTATAGNALSQITALSQTVSTHTSAYTTDKRDITTRLGNAESSLSTTSQAITTLNGAVSAMHTIQAVSIAGNKKALAGISLGSNGGAESSVIVMADKFNVVKNAQDGNVKPMFSVVNNQVAVNGDLIADGTVSARMIATNSITAGAIQAGAIRANHIATGEISADKLSVGLGGNLLYNPIFANPTNHRPDGWRSAGAGGNNSLIGVSDNTFDVNKNYFHCGLPTERSVLLQVTGSSKTDYSELWQSVNVIPNKWYMASVFLGTWDSIKTELLISLRDRNNTEIKAVSKVGTRRNFKNLDLAERVFLKFQIPSNCEKINFSIRCTGVAENVNFSIVRFARPMLEECTEHTREPSPWQNSGVTAIHGGSIVTNTITAQQMAANTITANEIASNAIATRHLSANSVNASHITTRTLTADKLNINSLSAISANLGDMTAGTIRGVTITGTNISGTTITGGVITGARLEGVTGKFSGQLEVTEIIGGGIYENITSEFKRTSEKRYATFRTSFSSDWSGELFKYQAVVTIRSAKVRRLITLKFTNRGGERASHYPSRFLNSGSNMYNLTEYDNGINYDGYHTREVSVTSTYGVIKNGAIIIPQNIDVTLTFTYWAGVQLINDRFPPNQSNLRGIAEYNINVVSNMLSDSNLISIT